jgi:hypothetical protein
VVWTPSDERTLAPWEDSAGMQAGSQRVHSVKGDGSTEKVMRHERTLCGLESRRARQQAQLADGRVPLGHGLGERLVEEVGDHRDLPLAVVAVDLPLTSATMSRSNSSTGPIQPSLRSPSSRCPLVMRPPGISECNRLSPVGGSGRRFGPPARRSGPYATLPTPLRPPAAPRPAVRDWNSRAARPA